MVRKKEAEQTQGAHLTCLHSGINCWPSCMNPCFCRFAWIDSAGRFGVTPRTDSTPWGREVEVTFTVHSFSEGTPEFSEGEEFYRKTMGFG